MSYYFAVVVGVDERDVAVPFDLYREVEEEVVLLHPLMAMELRQPVFNVGEVLILDEDGREIPYPGRKPSKWRVQIEEYGHDVAGALARSREVFEESLRSQAAKDES